MEEISGRHNEGRSDVVHLDLSDQTAIAVEYLNDASVLIRQGMADKTIIGSIQSQGINTHASLYCWGIG